MKQNPKFERPQFGWNEHPSSNRAFLCVDPIFLPQTAENEPESHLPVGLCKDKVCFHLQNPIVFQINNYQQPLKFMVFMAHLTFGCFPFPQFLRSFRCDALATAAPIGCSMPRTPSISSRRWTARLRWSLGRGRRYGVDGKAIFTANEHEDFPGFSR